MQNWAAYERHAVAAHAQRTGHTTWHWCDVPEAELHAAGYVHDFNRLRLQRLADAARGAEPSINRLRDYGLDGLAFDGHAHHGLQAKHWAAGGRRLTAGDLGSFFSVVHHRLRRRHAGSRGYLYHTCGLETALEEDLHNGDSIVAVALPAAAPAPAPAAEPELLPHQASALRTLQAAFDDPLCEALRLVCLPCGTGKTLLAAHLLRWRGGASRRVVVLAPLRALVDQLRRRLAPFCGGRDTLVVDSDPGGETSHQAVREWVGLRDAWVVFSTYQSAVDVLARAVDAPWRELVLVDEVHNATGSAGLCRLLNSFKEGLLLSATPPEQLYEQLNAREVVRLSLADAIAQGLVCDFRLWLPLLEDVRGGARVDDASLAELPPTLALQALFLARGMLHTGSRRCIAFLATSDDCERFEGAFAAVAARFHGVPHWTERIVAAVTPARRAQILADFQAQDDKLCVLTSVRVLDEGIDVPRCDSVFLASLTEKSSVTRTVQRMMRGCRRTADHPAKLNHVFVWCDDWDGAASSLVALKQADPSFVTRMRSLGVHYDAQRDERARAAEAAQTASMAREFDVKCESVDDRWQAQYSEVLRFYEQHGGHGPRRCSDSSDKERAMGRWVVRMRGLRDELPAARVALLEAVPGWKWRLRKKHAKWAEAVRAFAAFWAARLRQPFRRSPDAHESWLAEWVYYMRKNRDKLPPDQVTTLDALQGWVWKSKRTSKRAKGAACAQGN
jgi:superfamily II DNA or RNA helicase